MLHVKGPSDKGQHQEPRLPQISEQVSFSFMAAVTIHNDFGAQENKICHCFHYGPIYLP